MADEPAKAGRLVIARVTLVGKHRDRIARRRRLGYREIEIGKSVAHGEHGVVLLVHRPAGPAGPLTKQYLISISRDTS